MPKGYLSKLFDQESSERRYSRETAIAAAKTLKNDLKNLGFKKQSSLFSTRVENIIEYSEAETSCQITLFGRSRRLNLSPQYDGNALSIVFHGATEITPAVCISIKEEYASVFTDGKSARGITDRKGKTTEKSFFQLPYDEIKDWISANTDLAPKQTPQPEKKPQPQEVKAESKPVTAPIATTESIKALKKIVIRKKEPGA